MVQVYGRVVNKAIDYPAGKVHQGEANRFAGSKCPMSKREMLVGEKPPYGNASKADPLGPGSIDVENGNQSGIDKGINREGDPADQDESQSFGDESSVV